MSNPSIFNFTETAALRVITDEHGELWFVATDVCNALEMTVEATRRLDDDEKGLTNIQTQGGEQQATIISESGLYSLVLRSRKPEAKRFKKWVTSEVLPTIRKTGQYEAPSGQRYRDARNSPPTINDPAFITLCQAHASQAAARIGNQLFQHLLRQTQNSLDGDRFLLTFRGDTPFFERLPADALVANLSRLTQMIGNPNGMMVDQAQLADLLATCSARLAKSIQYQLRMTKKNQRI